MKKYLSLIKVHLHNYFVYRVNFLILRFRGLISFFIVYFLWQSVYTYKSTIGSYSLGMMMTYIFVSKILSEIVASTSVDTLGAMILNGDLINYMLKPLSVFKALFFIDIFDKVINFSFAMLEVGLFILIFHPNLFLQMDFNAYFLILVFLVGGVLISFFIYFMISCAGFWTNQIWALRFAYITVSTLFAGGLFPLDLLPQPIYKLILLTPFPYLYFLPARIYFGKVQDIKILFLIMFFWVGVMFWLAYKVWRRGLKSYVYYGR